MELYINTTKNKAEDIELYLKEGNSVISTIIREANRKQSELLLGEVENLLKNNCLELKDIDSIIVENQGGAFTALRIGIVTANTLSYAMGIPVYGARNAIREYVEEQCKLRIVKPIYDSEPNITQKKPRLA